MCWSNPADVIAAALFGIFVIPMLYVVFQWMRERTARTTGTPTLEGCARESLQPDPIGVRSGSN